MRGMSALRPTTVIERVWCDESSSAVWREPMGGEKGEERGGRLDCRGDLQRVLLREIVDAAVPRHEIFAGGDIGWGVGD